MRQIILFFLGFAFLVLGAIGLLIPVIPQVPFFIAAFRHREKTGWLLGNRIHAASRFSIVLPNS